MHVPVCVWCLEALAQAASTGGVGGEEAEGQHAQARPHTVQRAPRPQQRLDLHTANHNTARHDGVSLGTSWAGRGGVE